MNGTKTQSDESRIMSEKIERSKESYELEILAFKLILGVPTVAAILSLIILLTGCSTPSVVAECPKVIINKALIMMPEPLRCYDIPATSTTKSEVN